MNKMAGLLVVLLIPVFSPSPDYAFRLAWEAPPPLLVTDYEDLNGDGLSEILCITHDEEMKHPQKNKKSMGYHAVYHQILPILGFLSYVSMAWFHTLLT